MNEARWEALRPCNADHTFEFDDTLKALVCMRCGWSETDIQEAFERKIEDYERR